MWLVNLLMKKGLWAVQVTHHFFVRKSSCRGFKPRHHSWEALWNDYCFPTHLLSHPFLGIRYQATQTLLLHAVHQSFIFLTPGWKWKSKAHNQNRKNWKLWGNWVMYLCIDVCHNPLSCWFSAVSNRNPNKTAAWIAIYMFMLLPDHWRQSICKEKWFC